LAVEVPLTDTPGLVSVDVPLTETPGLVAVDVAVTGGVLTSVVLVPETVTPGLVAVTVGVTMTVGVAVALVDVEPLVDVLGDVEPLVDVLGDVEPLVDVLGDVEPLVDVLGDVETVVDSDVLGDGVTHGVLSTVHGRPSMPATEKMNGGSKGLLGPRSVAGMARSEALNDAYTSVWPQIRAGAVKGCTPTDVKSKMSAPTGVCGHMLAGLTNFHV
jgi:hypothetical protein